MRSRSRLRASAGGVRSGAPKARAVTTASNAASSSAKFRRLSFEPSSKRQASDWLIIPSAYIAACSAIFSSTALRIIPPHPSSSTPANQRRQSLAQFHHSEPCPCFDCPQRLIELRGDLAVAQAGIVGQLDHLALFR